MAALGSTTSRPAGRGRWRRPAAWAAVLLALAGVFAAYLQPDLMVTLANQVWACF